MSRWGEKIVHFAVSCEKRIVSVLNREPMGRKGSYSIQWLRPSRVSVLNREPMGRKDRLQLRLRRQTRVSVLNREPMGRKGLGAMLELAKSEEFQCSTVSRWGEKVCTHDLRSYERMFQCSTVSRWGEKIHMPQIGIVKHRFQCSTVSRWGEKITNL